MSADSGARPSPSSGRCSTRPPYDVDAAEPYAERAGERGLAAARRSGWGAGRRPAAARAYAARGEPPASGRARGGEQAGEPGGHPVGDVVERARRPSRSCAYAGTAVADHRVERVHRPVGEQAGHARRPRPRTAARRRRRRCSPRPTRRWRGRAPSRRARPGRARTGGAAARGRPRRRRPPAPRPSPRPSRAREVPPSTAQVAAAVSSEVRRRPRGHAQPRGAQHAEAGEHRAACLRVGVQPAFESAGGAPERGDRMAAPRVAGQRVQGDPGEQTLLDRHAMTLEPARIGLRYPRRS